MSNWSKNLVSVNTSSNPPMPITLVSCQKDSSDCLYSDWEILSNYPLYIVNPTSDISFNISSQYYSLLPLWSSSVDSSTSLVPAIPDSFTSWLSSLLTNFWSTIVDWLPTIILMSLWIYAIFSLFRVVRNYARSSFNW